MNRMKSKVCRGLTMLSFVCAVLHASAAKALPPPSAAARPEPQRTPPVPPTPGSPDMKDELFAGTEKFAKNATSVQEINMNADSLDDVSGGYAGRARSMVLNVVRSYSYDKPGQYNPAEVDEYRNRLNASDWHCSVHLRDLKTGESTDVCARHRSDDLQEKAIITVEPKQLTFIHTITRPSAAKGRSAMGLPPGFDKFEKLDELRELPFALDPVFAARMEASQAASQARMQARIAAAMTQARAGLAGFAANPAGTHIDLDWSSHTDEEGSEVLRKVPAQPRPE